MLLVHKHSYQAKEEIKRLGGRWNKIEKGWDMPDRSAYDEALEYCNAIGSSEIEDTDEVEDIPGWLKSIDWMYRENESTYTVPLKENSGKSVKSGQVFTGIRYHGDIQTVHQKWIVTCKKEEWNNSFACVNTETLQMRFMSEEEIRTYPWVEKHDISKAQKYWNSHLQVH